MVGFRPAAGAPILWALGGAFVLMFPLTFVTLWPYRGADLVAPELPAAIQEALAGTSTITGFGNVLPCRSPWRQ